MKLTHKHHIVPEYMGGSDDPSNIIELTIEEHAEAHRKLYEQHGNWQDFIAWKALSGTIGKDEIIKIILSNAGKKGGKATKGLKRSKEIRQNHCSKYWTAISPHQQIFNFQNLNLFCEENDLQPQCMRNVAKGRASNHKGWKCYIQGEQVKFNHKPHGGGNIKQWILTDPEGNTIQVSNLKSFCNDNNLNYHCMFAVASQRTQQHKQWQCRPC